MATTQQNVNYMPGGITSNDGEQNLVSRMILHHERIWKDVKGC